MDTTDGKGLSCLEQVLFQDGRKFAVIQLVVLRHNRPGHRQRIDGKSQVGGGVEIGGEEIHGAVLVLQVQQSFGGHIQMIQNLFGFVVFRIRRDIAAHQILNELGRADGRHHAVAIEHSPAIGVGRMDPLPAQGIWDILVVQFNQFGKQGFFSGWRSDLTGKGELSQQDKQEKGHQESSSVYIFFHFLLSYYRLDID